MSDLRERVVGVLVKSGLHNRHVDVGALADELCALLAPREEEPGLREAVESVLRSWDNGQIITVFQVDALRASLTARPVDAKAEAGELKYELECMAEGWEALEPNYLGTVAIQELRAKLTARPAPADALTRERLMAMLEEFDVTMLVNYADWANRILALVAPAALREGAKE